MIKPMRGCTACVAALAFAANAAAQTTARPAAAQRDTNQQAGNTGAAKTRSPDALLKPDPLDPLLRPADRAQAWLDSKKHLALKASYTLLNQYGVTTPGTRHDQVSARLDFQGVWTMHQQGGFENKAPHADQTTLNLLVRSGTNIGQSQQWDLNDSLGSTQGINSLQGSGAQRPIMVNLLYLKQTWDQQRVALYVGKLHPNQHIGLSPVNNDESSQFLGGPFDGDAAQTALGTYAPGIALEVGPPNGFYSHLLVIDSKAKPWDGTQTLFDGRGYEALEGGWKRGTQGEGGRDLRVAIYHQNPPALGHGHGIGVGGDWEFHNGGLAHWMPFGRLGFDTKSGTAIQQVSTVGVAHTLPFGRKGDLFGAAATWTRPSTPGRHEQLTEAFYRLKVADSLEFSPDVEWLRNPANTAKIDSTVILGTRLKVIF
ncbi:carbohydrate porin [Acidipila sp. EB88]|uniref:carbohydrate porin n=1 Tax=Acidipila sp. EB88 TaxID=2305226 RepID=UPI0013156CD2|nr:carbohydrate porin [Acidipila sp. EB88]